MNVVGIDPGKSGAFAVLHGQEHSILGIWDMPMREILVGARRRSRIDHIALDILAKTLRDIYDVGRYVIEEVGGRPGEGAMGAFTFGEGFGSVNQALIGAGIAPERISSAVWKRDMRVPKDKDFAVARADHLFTQQQHFFRGPQGGLKDGRAEAAMIALWWLQRGWRK